jgi:hypothetical protein
VIAFGRHEPDQLLQLVAAGCENGAIAAGADAEYQPFAVDGQQPQLALMRQVRTRQRRPR